MSVKPELKFFSQRIFLAAMSCLMAALLWFVTMHTVNAQTASSESGKRLIVVHDGGADRGLLTSQTTLRQAFAEADIPVDPNDITEPGLDEKLVSNNYEVNVYRARPVTIIDGETRVKIMSPYRTAKQIAKSADITLRDEDIADIKANTDIVSQGAGVRLEITRATEFTLMLYGKKTTAYTQGKTVQTMIKEKGIKLANNDTVSVPMNAPIAAGMTVEIWRDGVQTVTEEQSVPFTVEKILDMDHPVGYRAIKTVGEPGARLVTYAIDAKDGKEVSRQEIQNVVSKQSVTQVELVGNKPNNPLSKSKGAGIFTDSQGVSHRETYYDLSMNIVINACGGGTYTIRGDGAKIDRDGYILIAANYGRYPRCTVVETSMGLGKVYDTGGFAARYPTGFDLATDWTNYDGR
jgi:uncharacterized protein YabE (DUF348 family)